jgi:hypothetical protein
MNLSVIQMSVVAAWSLIQTRVLVIIFLLLLRSMERLLKCSCHSVQTETYRRFVSRSRTSRLVAIAAVYHRLVLMLMVIDVAAMFLLSSLQHGQVLGMRGIFKGSNDRLLNCKLLH